MPAFDLETELSSFEGKVTHDHAQNGTVRLHYYAALGEGPLIVFLHGFLDH